MNPILHLLAWMGWYCEKAVGFREGHPRLCCGQCHDTLAEATDRAEQAEKRLGEAVNFVRNRIDEIEKIVTALSAFGRIEPGQPMPATAAVLTELREVLARLDREKGKP